MHIGNRAAEYGGEIINDAALHEYTDFKQHAIAVRVLEPTVIDTITSDDMAGMSYYTAATLDIDSPIILANITGITLTSGAVQVIFGEG